MVRRIYVEKKPSLRQEAAGLLHELRTLLGSLLLSGDDIYKRIRSFRAENEPRWPLPSSCSNAPMS